ncbi:hypothetical protein ACHWQZ_G011154 [Mnemiopsis leidyi]
MAVSTNVSFLLSSVLAITTLAASQTFKAQLAESKGMTILGGGVASLFFMFVLTAIGNLEDILMGKGFELQLIPEVAFALTLSMAVAGSIHRVSITCCLIFSLVILYFMNNISQKTHGVPEAAPTKVEKKKRR